MSLLYYHSGRLSTSSKLQRTQQLSTGTCCIMYEYLMLTLTLSSLGSIPCGARRLTVIVEVTLTGAVTLAVVRFGIRNQQ